MNRPSPVKFGFRIRTRNGSVVDNLHFFGKDEQDAERKLRQIYVGCEILEVRVCISSAPRTAAVTFEDVADLISAGV